MEDLDITELDYTKDFSKIGHTGTDVISTVFYNSVEAANTSINNSVGTKVVNGEVISGIDNIYLNRQYEKAGRDFSCDIELYTVSKLDSSKSVQSKSDILRKLLDDNQKTYS